jgi:hypothetical protein
MNNPGRLLLGIGLLIAGVLFLLDLADVLEAGPIIRSWWPVIVIGFGLAALVGPAKSVIGGSIVTGAGVILLIASLDILPISAGELILPLILIAVGLGLLLIRAGVTSRGDEQGRINAFSMFGGQTITARSTDFTGGSVTAIFGGADLDLRPAIIAPDGAGIETFAAFGSVSIIVPRGWRVTVSGMPLFAGFEDKIDRSAPIDENAPHITVTGVAAFGSVEVKHERD